jgi:hypothetical protein
VYTSATSTITTSEFCGLLKSPHAYSDSQQAAKDCLVTY